VASAPPPVVVLCGGRGTRLQEHTEAIPKPLVEVGGEPILWHVIQLYATQGHRHFILCLGYRGDQVTAFVESQRWPSDTELECVDTGLETPTGERVRRVADHIGDQTFCVTYADGVADIDLQALIHFHRAHGAAATVTVVRPRLQFGVAELDGDDRVARFHEKPRSEHWINGGFMCFEPRALRSFDEGSVLEREPLERLAADGELRAYRHTGFWDCMDTYKDAVMLNDAWSRGEAPWKVWT
jgi:glucose-1-phosphate cytidylyltransferase